MTVRRIALAVGAISILALTVWWLTRDRLPRRGRWLATGPVSSSRGLDIKAFRARLAQARARAAELRRRHPRPTTGAAESKRASNLAGSMLSPQCILGPADLCATIADTVDACDEGDASACLAVGQFLEDNPPRPLVALSFFHYACKAGDQAGCERVAQLKARPETPPPCADDPLACGWRAMRSRNEDDADDACAAGVADACAMMLDVTEDQPIRQRGYLEIACELGNPMACQGLAVALSPDCTESCYPPDPQAAAEAATIACEVGFTSVCDRALPP